MQFRIYFSGEHACDDPIWIQCKELHIRDSRNILVDTAEIWFPIDIGKILDENGYKVWPRVIHEGKRVSFVDTSG